MKPELRFLEFEENWSYKKLKDLLKVHSGRDFKHLEPGEIPVYGTGGYMLSVSDYLSNDDAIGIGRKGTINKPYLLKAPFWTVDTLFYCTPWEEVDLYFLLSLFKKINWEKYDESTSVPSLSKVNIEKLKVYSCELEEQRKIGDFFSKLDQQIELEEQKLSLLEEQKKGYMQKIFSQELRFKNDKENNYPEWEVKQLKEILEFSNKRTTKENEYPILTSSRKGLILQSDYYKEGKTFADSNVGYFILPKNFITYRSRSDDGIFKFNLNQIIDTGIISKYYPVFKGINSNQYYLALHLNNQLKKEYIKYATGTSQLVLSHKNLQEIKTKLPFYDEQTKIADFLIKFDELIEKQNQKIDGLKSRKKGFLQKMFV